MKTGQEKTLKIGIIGAGFSGTALVAALHKLHRSPLEIYLFEKTGCFGSGPAYDTPYPFHLLNVRACDMSALQDEPDHFVTWLNSCTDIQDYLEDTIPCGDQFLPRFLYRQYLRHLLHTIQSDVNGKIRVRMESAEVIDIVPSLDETLLKLSDGREIPIDKTILATGNHPPTRFAFPVSAEMNAISNPWDYTAPKKIAKNDPILIVGTGLSMIDTVLTLYHQKHEGDIYAISRHGLLPLPHADCRVPFILIPEKLPLKLRSLLKQIRIKSHQHASEGGDWRSVINALRSHMPEIWAQTSLPDKKRFLRHALPYWNIHRHRVRNQTADFLDQLIECKQLKMMSGYILAVENGQAKIRLRYTNEVSSININWIINCMGPALNAKLSQQPLEKALLQRGLAMLDPLQLGFLLGTNGALKNANGDLSSILYTVGPPRKSASWESGAVPEIRKQCFDLARELLCTP